MSAYGTISRSYEQSLNSIEGAALVQFTENNSTDFQLSSFNIDYEPYPVIFIKNILPLDFYNSLVKAFPDESLLKHFPAAGDKYLLSEGSDEVLYTKVLNDYPVWQQLYKIIKSSAFINSIYSFLRTNHVDIGIEGLPVYFPAPLEKLNARYITSRFEFSSLSANGGYHIPHTDIAKKLVSLIIPIVSDDDWKDNGIGGMSVCYPKRKEFIYNQVNKPLLLEEVEIIRKYEFLANSCVLFPKTFNSWHCVEKVFNPHVLYRRSIVIQLIESR